MTCKRCNGSGWNFMRDDPSPAGISLSPGSMDCSEPCEDCLGQDRCPVCGIKVLRIEEPGVDRAKCIVCGYDSEKAFEAGPIWSAAALAGMKEEQDFEDAPVHDPSPERTVAMLLGRYVEPDEDEMVINNLAV